MRGWKPPFSGEETNGLPYSPTVVSRHGFHVKKSTKNPQMRDKNRHICPLTTGTPNEGRIVSPQTVSRSRSQKSKGTVFEDKRGLFKRDEPTGRKYLGNGCWGVRVLEIQGRKKLYKCGKRDGAGVRSRGE